jgi:hypothetical protein
VVVSVLWSWNFVICRTRGLRRINGMSVSMKEKNNGIRLSKEGILVSFCFVAVMLASLFHNFGAIDQVIPMDAKICGMKGQDLRSEPCPSDFVQYP